MKQLIQAAVVFIELFVLGNGLLIAFLLGAWMEGDAFAYSANEADWWIEAGKRFVVVSVLSIVVSVFVWVVNKPFLTWSGFENERLPRITAVVALGSLCSAGLAGVITFAVTKPYM